MVSEFKNTQNKIISYNDFIKDKKKRFNSMLNSLSNQPVITNDNKLLKVKMFQ